MERCWSVQDIKGTLIKFCLRLTSKNSHIILTREKPTDNILLLRKWFCITFTNKCHWDISFHLCYIQDFLTHWLKLYTRSDYLARKHSDHVMHSPSWYRPLALPELFTVLRTGWLLKSKHFKRQRTHNTPSSIFQRLIIFTIWNS